jgi:hypothetical protein
LFGKIIISSKNEELIQSCKKSGSWKIYDLRFKKVWWTSRYQNYFSKLNPTKTLMSTYDRFLERADLVCYKNVRIKSKKNNSSSLNLYNGKIIVGKRKNTIDKALYLDIKGNESFQHFIHECLPVLMLGKEFLHENQSIPIVLKHPLDNFRNRDNIIRMLGIKNQIIYSEQLENCGIKELYLFDFKPKNFLYASSPKYRNKAYLQILKNKQIKKLDKPLIILLLRDGQTRKFMNFLEIKNFIQNKAIELDLDFKVINPSKISFSELVNIFGNSKFVFGVHGGANYNMIFAPPTATLIEFINTDSTDSLCDLVTSFGQTYFPFAIKSSKGDEFVSVQESDLMEIFSHI